MSSRARTLLGRTLNRQDDALKITEGCGQGFASVRARVDRRSPDCTDPCRRRSAPRFPILRYLVDLSVSRTVYASCMMAEKLRDRTDNPASLADAELAGKLKQELQWENEAGSTAEPEFLADFKKEGNFDVTTSAGACGSSVTDHLRTAD